MLTIGTVDENGFNQITSQSVTLGIPRDGDTIDFNGTLYQVTGPIKWFMGTASEIRVTVVAVP